MANNYEWTTISKVREKLDELVTNKVVRFVEIRPGIKGLDWSLGNLPAIVLVPESGDEEPLSGDSASTREGEFAFHLYIASYGEPDGSPGPVENMIDLKSLALNKLSEDLDGSGGANQTDGIQVGRWSNMSDEVYPHQLTRTTITATYTTDSTGR